MTERSFRRLLLRWFEENRRTFFWRRKRVTPWQVLVSEFLLRKTGAAQADPIIRELLRLGPTPRAMAARRTSQIERVIRPLGLQRIRARAIREIAKTLVAEHGGRVPRDSETLRSLPHVGPYIAHSTMTVGFDDPHPIVDANVMRIYHRVFLAPEAVEIHKADWLWIRGWRLMPKHDCEKAKDFNWALVDFGALICRARGARCDTCPMRKGCPSAGRV